MITNEVLLQKAHNMWKYGEYHHVDIKKPLGVDILPLEWELKVGEHYLEQPYLVEIENVHLCGQAMTGIVDNDVILDTSYYGRIDLMERNSPYFNSAREAYKTEPREIELAMSFVGVWSHNYFHWILDHLPKLEAVDLYRKEINENPVLLIASKPPSFIEETIAQLPYNWQRIDYPHYIIKKLLVATTRRKQGIMYLDALQYLKHMFHVEQLYTSPNIYISRKLASNRKVMNEDELDEYLLQRGFQLLTMERMSIIDQIGRMKNARTLISPHGAGLANMVWGKQMRVLELVQPEYTNPCLWLAGAMREDIYGYVIGDAEEGENMSIPMEKFDKVMEMLC